MIRVRKPPDPPAILRTRGRRAARDVRKAYDTSPGEYAGGKKTFDFDRALYAVMARAALG